VRNRIFLKALAAFTLVILAATLTFRIFTDKVWPGLLVAFVVALVFSAIDAYSTAPRLQRIVQFAGRVAAGDFAARLDESSADEIGQVSASLDKTARHLEESFTALQTSQRLLETLLNSMQDAVIAIGADDRVQWANEAMDELVPQRTRRDALLVETVRDPDFLAAVREASELRKVSTARAASILPGRTFEVTAAPMPVGGAVAVLRDLTETERVEKTRRDFIANVSHELRTPLTVISGYLDTLADDTSVDPAWSGPIKDMRAQAQRMNAIIADLLVLSRLESTDGEAARDAIDVPNMLERLHRDALASADRPRHVVLELESTAGLFGSAHEVESAFTNLLVNGMKYTLAEGTVRMRWWADAEGAYFSVIDSGIGIPAEHIPRLTERFYRVDAGRSRGQGGSGLGLAIVKHALQRHGGWLDVQSTEGKGSTFTCHFPQQRIWQGTVHAAASA